MRDVDRVDHGFGPCIDHNTQVLILGSFPSVKSRAIQFYYGHQQNRFWPLMAKLFDTDIPESIEAKKQWCHQHHIGLYDVIESCTIKGSSDASISDVVLCDIDALDLPHLKLIILNGKTAGKYDHGRNDVMHVVLPSTSSANAMYSLERLSESWSIIKSVITI